MHIASRRVFASLSSIVLLGVSPAAMAQQQTQDETAQGDPYAGTAYDGDYVTVGAGPAVGPSYEGSDNYVIFPFAAATGRVAGIEFQPRGLGFAFDVIPDAEDARIGFLAGPVVRARLDRNSNIEDAVVASLGERDIAVEVGGTLGVALYQVTNPYDSLTAQVDVRWDVAGAHDGVVIAPQIAYFTPVSRGAAITLAVSAEHVDDDFADYYYDIGPAGALASGLPQFDAEGGWKNVGANFLLAVDLDGELSNGGWAVFAGGGYSRLLEDAKRTPITSVRGDADQWLGTVGIGYTF